jgi:hypothetical protein
LSFNKERDPEWQEALDNVAPTPPAKPRGLSMPPVPNNFALPRIVLDFESQVVKQGGTAHFMTPGHHKQTTFAMVDGCYQGEFDVGDSYGVVRFAFKASRPMGVDPAPLVQRAIPKPRIVVECYGGLVRGVAVMVDGKLHDVKEYDEVVIDFDELDDNPDWEGFSKKNDEDCVLFYDWCLAGRPEDKRPTKTAPPTTEGNGQDERLTRVVYNDAQHQRYGLAGPHSGGTTRTDPGHAGPSPHLS